MLMMIKTEYSKGRAAQRQAQGVIFQKTCFLGKSCRDSCSGLAAAASANSAREVRMAVWFLGLHTRGSSANKPQHLVVLEIPAAIPSDGAAAM